MHANVGIDNGTSITQWISYCSYFVWKQMDNNINNWGW